MATVNITANIEERVYNYKAWYKAMDTLVGEYFDSTAAYAATLAVGTEIDFDCDKPTLPPGLTIPAGSKITLVALACKTLRVTNVTHAGTTITVDVGILSTRLK